MRERMFCSAVVYTVCAALEWNTEKKEWDERHVLEIRCFAMVQIKKQSFLHAVKPKYMQSVCVMCLVINLFSIRSSVWVTIKPQSHDTMVTPIQSVFCLRVPICRDCSSKVFIFRGTYIAPLRLWCAAHCCSAAKDCAWSDVIHICHIGYLIRWWKHGFCLFVIS